VQTAQQQADQYIADARKARDRAVRARYYDSLAESRTGNTPQNLRRLQQAVADQLKKEFPQGRLQDEAAYLARQKELLDQVSASFGIDVSALAATPIDTVAGASGAAVPQADAYTIRSL